MRQDEWPVTYNTHMRTTHYGTMIRPPNHRTAHCHASKQSVHAVHSSMLVSLPVLWPSTQGQGRGAARSRTPLLAGGACPVSLRLRSHARAGLWPEPASSPHARLIPIHVKGPLSRRRPNPSPVATHWQCPRRSSSSRVRHAAQTQPPHPGRGHDDTEPTTRGKTPRPAGAGCQVPRHANVKSTHKRTNTREMDAYRMRWCSGLHTAGAHAIMPSR